MMKTIVLNIFLETLISFLQDSLINKKYQKNSIYVHYNSFVTVYMFLLSLLINSMYPFLISLIITRNLAVYHRFHKKLNLKSYIKLH